MIKTLNVDKQERGGGRIMYFCPNITNYKRVDDGFRGDPLHSHLEIYCDEKPLPKSEH